MIKLIKQANEHDLDPIDTVEVKKVQTNVDKKYNWLKSQENTIWKDWPNKSPQNRASPQLSTKRTRNMAKRRKRADNRLKSAAREAIDNGTVINLTDINIPPEAIVLLSKRAGFVPTGKYDALTSRTHCLNTMFKLTSRTERLIKDRMLSSCYSKKSTDEEQVAENDAMMMRRRLDCLQI